MNCNHEQAFIDSFVVPAKRARYTEFLPVAKRRQEILHRFNHFFDFVPNLAEQTPRSSPEELTALLRKHGAPAVVYVIGGQILDGHESPLAEAVGKVFCDGWGTVISCLPGKLALYFQEFPDGNVFLLTK